MSFKRVFSNSALVLGGEVVERILRLALVVFSARLLGDVQYGKFAFALSYASLFLILADFGLHQLIVREIARTPDKTKLYLSNGLFLKLIFSALTYVLIIGIVQFTGKGQNDLTAVYVIGAAFIIGSFAEFFSSVFRAHQKMTYDVTATLIFGAFVNSVGITILFMGFNFVVLAYVYLGAHILRVLYCILIVQFKFVPIRISFDLSTMKFLIKEGFPFGILYFFALMYTYIDSTMLSLMKGDEPVGWYNAAYRLVFAMMFIPTATMKVVFPALSLYYKQSMDLFKSLFERSFKVMFLLGFSIAALIFSLSDRIIALLFGEEYLPAANALKILVWSTATIFIGTVQTHATRASNQQGFTAKVVSASAVLNVVLNFILIPKYSLYGAAFATLASELFTFLLHSRYLAIHLVMPPIFKLAPKIAIICAAVMLYVNAVSGVNLMIVLITSGLLIVVMALITRYFTKEEMQFISHFIKQPRKFATT